MEIVLHPRMPDSELIKKRISLALADFSDHVVFLSSGSVKQKAIALSREALLASARTMVDVLGMDSRSRVLHILPEFHVGGYAVPLRAKIAGAEIVKSPWPIIPAGITHLSLVPTQLYDLVRAGIKPPTSLKNALIGGGALSPQLESQASALGWPLLISYGMTEAASTVALRTDVGFEMLSHLECRENGGRLELRGPSICTAIWDFDTLIFERKSSKDWFMTDDCVDLHGRVFELFGRHHLVLKICGELVHLGRLRLQYEEFGHLLALPHERRGYELILLIEKTHFHESMLAAIDSLPVLPFERVRKVYLIDTLPRSSLGKVLDQQCLGLLDEGSSIVLGHKG